MYLLYLHSLASEMGHYDIHQKTFSSISMLDLNDDEMASLGLSEAAILENSAAPFEDFADFMARKRETNLLTEYLTDLLSADDLLWCSFMIYLC